MQALQKTAPAFGVELRDVAEPAQPGPGEVLLEVAAVGICGSDVHVYEWTGGYEFVARAMPLTLGHEFAARVAAAGPGVAGLRPGERVTVLPSVTCGRCAHCRAGRDELCTERTGLGMTRPGAFARWTLAPARNCVPIPSAVDDELAALTEPLTVGARAVELGEIRRGDRVLILGPGTIGQAVALMAREAGAAEIVVVGRDDPGRLATLAALGFTDTIDVAATSLEQRLGAGRRFDVVFEAVGLASTLTQGLSFTRYGGVLVVVGIHPAPVTIDVTALVRQQQQIRGSHRADPGTWARVLALLARDGERIRPMITHRLPLEAALEGFELARRKIASKVVVLPGA